MSIDLCVPLEANPEVFNPLAATIGLDTSRYCLHDVLGLDEDLLAFVPQPVEAVILLFPTPERWDYPIVVAADAAAAEKAPVDKDGLVYFRQKLSNHCGTMALLHALANTPSLPIADGPMKELFERCRGLGPDESADLLGGTNITTSHKIASSGGQSDPNAPLTSHFLAFVNRKGHLLELDGWGHSGPITHGPIQGDLLHSAVNVVKAMMADTGSINYSLMAIAPTQDL